MHHGCTARRLQRWQAVGQGLLTAPAQTCEGWEWWYYGWCGISIVIYKWSILELHSDDGDGSDDDDDDGDDDDDICYVVVPFAKGSLKKKSVSLYNK